MQRFLVLTWLFAAVTAEDVTPVQKVIQLLADMTQKGKDEMQAEKIQFAAYSNFCQTEIAGKTKGIKEATQKMAMLAANIEKNKADADRLSREINGHQGEISNLQTQKDNATTVRAKENADFQVTFKDYSESVDALNRAIGVLKKQAYSRKDADDQKEEADAKAKQEAGPDPSKYLSLSQVSALLELSEASDPMQTKEAIVAFLQDAQDPSKLPKAPRAAAYKHQSGGIIELLEKLQGKFIAEKKKVEDEEFKKQASFEMLVGDLKNQIEAISKAVSKKTAFMNKALADKAADQGSLDETTANRASDQKYTDDLKQECTQKASDFAERQKLRGEEIEAIAKASAILSGDNVSGTSAKYMPGRLLQSGNALAYLRSDAKRSRDVTDQVVQFLQQRATELNSVNLDRLVSRAEVSTAIPNADAMNMVAQMLKDLMNKLQQEAIADVSKKTFCDKELKTNKQTREAKASDIDDLTAEIDMLKSSIDKLTQDSAQLTKDIDSLQKAMDKATDFRNKEKANNTQTIKEAKEAMSAVEKALNVLQDFYAKAGDATALVQRESDSDSDSELAEQKPAIFDKKYTGMGGQNGGVTSMLQVIMADFARLQAETEAAEAAALKEYRQFMEDTRTDKAAKTATVQHHKVKMMEQKDALAQRKNDLAGTQKELDAAMKVFDELKPQCLDTGLSYEEECKRRDEEIASLKNALEMLNNADTR